MSGPPDSRDYHHHDRQHHHQQQQQQQEEQQQLQPMPLGVVVADTGSWWCCGAEELVGGGGGGAAEAEAQCPVCRRSARAYYCRLCVRSGEFGHSRDSACTQPSAAGGGGCGFCFATGRQQLFRLRHELVGYAIAVEEATEAARRRCRNTQRHLLAVRRRCQLVAAIEAARHRCVSTRHQLLAAQQRCRQLRQRQPAIRARLEQLSGQLAAMPGAQQRVRRRLAAQQRHLATVSDTNIVQLVRLVFPISTQAVGGGGGEAGRYRIRAEADASSVTNAPSAAEAAVAAGWSALLSDTERALSEAQSLSHVHGRWVQLDGGERAQRYCVVAPTLPASGDYSLFAVWLEETCAGAGGAGGGDLGRSAPAGSVLASPLYNVLAALQHVAQLVALCAFYMRVRVPNRLCYSQFCIGSGGGGGARGMSQRRFERLVARLNANVVFLCLVRGVDVCRLVARRTVANLVLLTDAAARGRYTPCCALIQPRLRPLIDAMEDSLRPYLERDTVTSAAAATTVTAAAELDEYDDDEDDDDAGGGQEDERHQSGAVEETDWEEVSLEVASAAAGFDSQLAAVNSTSVATALVSTAAASVASFFRGLNR